MAIRMCLRFLSVLWLLAWSLPGVAQPSDSLRLAVTLADSDSLRLDLLGRLTRSYYGQDFAAMDSSGLAYLRTAREAGDVYHEARAAMMLGASKLDQGALDMAMDYFLAAYQLADSTDHPGIRAFAVTNLASVYWSLGKKEQALTYYRLSLEAQREGVAPLPLATILYNLGITFQDLGMPDSARLYLQQAVAAAEEASDLATLSDIRNSLGMLMKDAGQLQQARQHYEAAIRYARQARAQERAYYPWLNLGALWLDLGNLRQAEQALDSAGHYAEAVGSQVMLADVLRQRIRSDSLQGDFQAAFARLRSWQALHDSILEERSKIKIGRMEAEFESLDRENKLAMLAEQHEAQSKQLMLRNRLAMALGSLAVLLAIGSIMLVRMARVRHRQNEQLRKINEEKGKLLHIVAHDLQNPVVNIRGLLDLLVNDSSFSPDQDRLVQLIKREIQRSDRLVRDILDYDYLLTEENMVRVEPVDLASLVRSVVSQFELQARHKGISIEVALPDPVPALSTDRVYVERILSNLVSNAVKFSSPGSQVVVTVEPGEMATSVKVKDHGPGMSEEDQRRLFQPFQTLSARPTGGESSIGLGLTLAKLLADNIQSKLLVTSQPGEGTEFSLRLSSH